MEITKLLKLEVRGGQKGYGEEHTCKMCKKRTIFKQKENGKVIYLQFDKEKKTVSYLIKPWIVNTVCNNCLRDMIRKEILNEMEKIPSLPCKKETEGGVIKIIVLGKPIASFESEEKITAFTNKLEKKLLQKGEAYIRALPKKLTLSERMIKVKSFLRTEKDLYILKSLTNITKDKIEKTSITSSNIAAVFAMVEEIDINYAEKAYKRGLVVNDKWDVALLSNKTGQKLVGKTEKVPLKIRKKEDVRYREYAYRGSYRWLRLLKPKKIRISTKYGKETPILVFETSSFYICFTPKKIKK